jgi:hypothetical protein
VTKEPQIRRSAGMLGRPQDAKAPSFPNTPPKTGVEVKQAQRVSGSRYPAPKVLMGEVIGPRGTEVGPQRDDLRAFMLAHHLSPTAWAKAAGVPAGELLAFLTGRTRAIAPASLEKLARAAKVAPEDLFRS